MSNMNKLIAEKYQLELQLKLNQIIQHLLISAVEEKIGATLEEEDKKHITIKEASPHEKYIHYRGAYVGKLRIMVNGLEIFVDFIPDPAK